MKNMFWEETMIKSPKQYRQYVQNLADLEDYMWKFPSDSAIHTINPHLLVWAEVKKFALRVQWVLQLKSGNNMYGFILSTTTEEIGDIFFVEVPQVFKDWILDPDRID